MTVHERPGFFFARGALNVLLISMALSTLPDDANVFERRTDAANNGLDNSGNSLFICSNTSSDRSAFFSFRAPDNKATKMNNKKRHSSVFERENVDNTHYR